MYTSCYTSSSVSCVASSQLEFSNLVLLLRINDGWNTSIGQATSADLHFPYPTKRSKVSILQWRPCPAAKTDYIIPPSYYIIPPLPPQYMTSSPSFSPVLQAYKTTFSQYWRMVKRYTEFLPNFVTRSSSCFFLRLVRVTWRNLVVTSF